MPNPSYSNKTGTSAIGNAKKLLTGATARIDKALKEANPHEKGTKRFYKHGGK